MDPVTNYQLGLIRQQELIEEAARDQRGEISGVEAVLINVWQRLGTVLNRASAARTQTPTQTPERAAQPNLITNIR